MNKKTKVFVALAVALLIPAASYAAIVGGSENYRVPADTIINENLYAAGSTLSISGKIFGDLLLAGGNIRVDGTVSKDAALAGGTIDVSGRVEDDLRVAGGTITLQSSVGGDAVIAGGTITLTSGSVVSGDVIIAGGQVTLDGTANKDVTVRGGELLINGTINGDVSFKGGHLTLGKTAVIKGNLSYSSETAATIESGAKVFGKTEFTKQTRAAHENRRNVFSQIFGIIFIIKLLVSLAVVSVGFWLFKKVVIRVSEEGEARFMHSVGFGFVFLIIAPIFSIVLLVSILGSLLGVFSIFLYILFLMSAKIMAGILLGGLLMKFQSKTVPQTPVTWQAAYVGTIILNLLWFIPIVGPLVGCVLFLASLGAIVRIAWVNRMRVR